MTNSKNKLKKVSLELRDQHLQTDAEQEAQMAGISVDAAKAKLKKGRKEANP